MIYDQSTRCKHREHPVGCDHVIDRGERKNLLKFSDPPVLLIRTCDLRRCKILTNPFNMSRYVQCFLSACPPISCAVGASSPHTSKPWASLTNQCDVLLGLRRNLRRDKIAARGSRASLVGNTPAMLFRAGRRWFSWKRDAGHCNETSITNRSYYHHYWWRRRLSWRSRSRVSIYSGQ